MRDRRALSDSITALIILVVAVTLTLTVALLGFTLFKQYGSQNVVVSGVPTLYHQDGKPVLNVTLKNLGTSEVRIEGVEIGGLHNDSVFVLSGGSIETLSIQLSGSETFINGSVVQVVITTSSQLEPTIFTYAKVVN
ncbi:MAG: hypothetical protein QXF40_02150 [Metallosphaera sp.]|uniref:hypothetical protein n=1 Tax=Metallosphaera sp. TaxID=2020860 RepID=UPI003166D28B